MQFVIFSIWFLISGLVIYNVFYDSSVSTFGYIVICMISAAPLAGNIILATFNDDETFDSLGEKIVGIGFVGLIVGAVVSVVDFFFISKGFVDFFCDLIEIGFGFFAFISYFVAEFLLRLLKLDEMSVERRNQQRSQSMAMEIANNAAIIRQNRLIQEREAAERNRRISENAPGLRNEIITIINNNLASIIANNLAEKKYVAFGSKEYKEKYYVGEHPIKKLKPKTEKLVEKTALMTTEELDVFLRDDSAIRN